MKWAISTLVIVGFAAFAEAAGGSYFFLDGSLYIGFGSNLIRLMLLSVGGVSLVAAYGCIRRKAYGWYLVNGLLTTALCLTISVGIYRLVYYKDEVNSRAAMLINFAPAIATALLLFRVWPARRTEFKSIPLADVGATPAKAVIPFLAIEDYEKPTDDPYTFIGAFTPHEAHDLLERFETAKVRFQVDVDTRASRRRGGSFTVRWAPGSIAIFLHDDDRTKAETIISKLSKTFGSL